jgi:hypothetical protein
MHYILRSTNLTVFGIRKLQQQWKESIIVHIYRKGNKTDYNNYRGISLLPGTYKIFLLEYNGTVHQLIKMWMNITYSKVCRGKNVSDAFPIQNSLKQESALSPLLFNNDWNLMEHISSWFMLMVLLYWVETQTPQTKTKKLC